MSRPERLWLAMAMVQSVADGTRENASTTSNAAGYEPNDALTRLLIYSEVVQLPANRSWGRTDLDCFPPSDFGISGAPSDRVAGLFGERRGRQP